MTDTEATARDLARRIIAVPGWAADLGGTVAAVRDLLAATADDPDIARQVGDRAAAILQEVATEPMALIERYPDLLPHERRVAMLGGALEALRDGRDAAGEMMRIANGAPGPVVEP